MRQCIDMTAASGGNDTRFQTLLARKVKLGQCLKTLPKLLIVEPYASIRPMPPQPCWGSAMNSSAGRVFLSSFQNSST
jgi:hypothetical protein